jgi:hypothetical protein
MATYKSVITIIPSGVVSVISADGTSYNTILNSQSGYVYGLLETYINTSSVEQLFEPYLYNRYDVNGNIQSYTENVLIDPYQIITASLFKPLKDNVIFDGRTSMAFTILPNQIIHLVFYVLQIANADMVTPTHFYNEDFFNVLNDYNQEL